MSAWQVPLRGEDNKKMRERHIKTITTTKRAKYLSFLPTTSKTLPETLRMSSLDRGLSPNSMDGVRKRGWVGNAYGWD